MIQKQTNQTYSPEQGFTLVELSIVILIIGLLSVPVVQMYSLYAYDKEISKTKENIETAKSALSLFPIRYPCPSDRSLPPTHPDYGVEKCSGIPPCVATCPPPPAPCGFTMTQGICQITTPYDRDGVGGNDVVFVGGLPYMYYESAFTNTWDPVSTGAKKPIKGMGGAGVLLDGWNNKMTYIVSANLVNPFSKMSTNDDFKLGVISAVNEHGAPTAGVNNDAQFAIISHGKNGSGAFTIEGNRVGDGCIEGMVETSNCKYNDSTFVQALGTYEGTIADYYDDITYFYLKAPGELWSYTTDATGKPYTHINNRNKDSVGVNTTMPTAKLDVNGTLQAATVRTNNICDATGANCINPTTVLSAAPVRTAPIGPNLTPSDSRCPDGRVAVAITNGSLVCDFLTIKPNTGAVNCPSGFFVKAITTNGCIICSDSSTTNEVCPP